MRPYSWLVVLLLLCSPPPASAAGLDVDGWLRRPGVKLVVVEVYATWCKPCMAAVPRWKALHEKYRDHGLRLLVVSTQDPGGTCTNPGWNPDEIICDDEGEIARALGASSLPSAYLWGWEGKLLVRRGHVDAIESAIERWQKVTPRVDVEVGPLAADAGIKAEVLRDLVRERLQDEDKLAVVATEEERRVLDKLKAKSFDARFSDRMQCEVGNEISANSLVSVRLGGSSTRKQLSLLLLSAEKGCLVAAASVPWSSGKAKVAVAEAVTSLISKLRTSAEWPTQVTEAAPVAVSKVVEVPKAPEVVPETKPAQKVMISSSKIEIKDQVHFKVASAALVPDSITIVQRIAEVMKNNADMTLRVECHTDNVGSSAAAKRLTEKRAETVVKHLRENGVDSARLTGAGYGQDRPIDTNDTNVGRARNRRCEFHVGP